ncbi:MAG: rRNA maturation RNase YbeY [bacterium]|nr:rRNA maturation RNase YbeY [bacterium]
MLKINLINEYDQSIKPYKKTIHKAMKVAYKVLSLRKKRIINVILVSNEKIHELNLMYRHIDLPTDVISFENEDSLEELGDVFISIDKTIAQANDFGHSFERELAFLSIHGFLHCNGFDHLTKEEETEMFSLQDIILEQAKFRR